MSLSLRDLDVACRPDTNTHTHGHTETRLSDGTTGPGNITQRNIHSIRKCQHVHADQLDELGHSNVIKVIVFYRYDV